MSITLVDFQKALRVSGATEAQIKEANNHFSNMVDYGLDNKYQLSNFIGQCAHECSGFTKLEESLNYSAERLVAVWPSRFESVSDAEPYAHNAEALANKVYGGRMGNDNDGDGYKYRGRGPIALTGKDNYTKCAQATGLDIVDHPELLATDLGAGLIAAAWFFDTNHLFEKAVNIEESTIKAITFKVNNGETGLDDRILKTHTVYKALYFSQGAFSLAKYGDKNTMDVFEAQMKLVKKGYLTRADGDFGTGSKSAAIQFQKDHGLSADGIVGPATYAVLCRP